LRALHRDVWKSRAPSCNVPKVLPVPVLRQSKTHIRDIKSLEGRRIRRAHGIQKGRWYWTWKAYKYSAESGIYPGRSVRYHGVWSDVYAAQELVIDTMRHPDDQASLISAMVFAHSMVDGFARNPPWRDGSPRHERVKRLAARLSVLLSEVKGVPANLDELRWRIIDLEEWEQVSSP